jgi:hypothetical protein
LCPYRWLANPVSDTEWDTALLTNAVFDAHHDDPEFGYRFLTDEVKDAGFSACERTVWRICAANGWWSVFGKKRSKKGATSRTPAHDDLVRRDFSADAPNELWLGDIERHEALSSREEVQDLLHRAVATSRSSSGQSDQGDAGEDGSSPDGDVPGLV